MANFVKVSCCQINLDNIAFVDYSNNLIHFIGGYSLELSQDMQEFKRILDERVKEGDE